MTTYGGDRIMLSPNHPAQLDGLSDEKQQSAPRPTRIV
jgi:hypothetical protein